ncbi:hypothetical protein [Chryseobacterium sp. Leaf201]|uniref:hypothetical protein n=1 Tax=Chryseobacterium sp. Leaf201 TaxID=1735672 RepID=UPI0006F87C20|nr:hypothetical protein [Chryseobacterium sp. Leaf201]KQM37456.1 hypothetical protein ASE55_14835 [Chryseobacterium sp. Leaf201]
MQHFNIGKRGRFFKILSIFTFVFIFSCGEPTDQNEIQKITSTYINNTNTSVKIINYKNSKKFERIIMLNKSLVQKNLEGSDEIPDSIIYRSDSAKVIFGNQKISKFKKFDNSNYNFLDGKNYNTNFPSTGSTEQTYTFTAADVNNAVPCNGSCN